MQSQGKVHIFLFKKLTGFKDYLNLLNIIFFSPSFTLTSEVNQSAIWKEY